MVAFIRALFRITILLVVLFGLIMFGRFAASDYITKKMNEILANNPMIKGAVGGISLKGKIIELENVKIAEARYSKHTYVDFATKKLRVNFDLASLQHRFPIANVVLNNPNLTVSADVDLRTHISNATRKVVGWSDNLGKDKKIDIPELEVKEGEITLIDQQINSPITVKITHINLKASNLGQESPRPRDVSKIEASAQIQDQGSFNISGTLDLKGETPKVNIQFEIKDLPAETLTSLAQKYGNYEIEGGILSFRGTGILENNKLHLKINSHFRGFVVKRFEKEMISQRATQKFWARAEQSPVELSSSEETEEKEIKVSLNYNIPKTLSKQEVWPQLAYRITETMLRTFVPYLSAQ